MNGASSAGMMTFETTPLQITAPVPTAAIIAPSMPPMSACEDEDGTLKYQVTRFQTIAPTRPANTIGTVTRFWSTMPFAIVAATETEMNAPAKLSTDASPTATRGGSARVAMTVAIAFAVSWKPFVKSKKRAVATTMPISNSEECTPFLYQGGIRRDPLPLRSARRSGAASVCTLPCRTGASPSGRRSRSIANSSTSLVAPSASSRHSSSPTG